jgi:hypothetical protein
MYLIMRLLVIFYFFNYLNLSCFCMENQVEITFPSSNKGLKFIDLKGKLVFDHVDCALNDFSDGLALVLIESRHVYINKKGEIAIDKHFILSGNFSEGLANFVSNEFDYEIDMYGNVNQEYKFRKEGYINKNGNIAIKPGFVYTNEFKEGLASVYFNGKGWGFINKKGEVVVEPENFKFDFSKTSYSEGLAIVRISRKWDNKPKDGYIFYRDYIGYMDKTGNVVIKGDFTGARNFSEGLAVIEQKGGVFSPLSGGSEKYSLGKFGYINKSGKVVIKAKYTYAKSFSEDFAAVCKKNSKWGYINKKGKMAIKPKFDEAFPFFCGIARVKIDCKYGFIDKTGRFLIEPKYKNARDFSQGFAAVELNERWGYIDNKGGNFIEPKFVRAYSFSEDFARVEVEIR